MKQLITGPWATGFMGSYVAFLITPSTFLLMLAAAGQHPIPWAKPVPLVVADLVGFVLLAGHLAALGAVRMASIFTMLALGSAAVLWLL